MAARSKNNKKQTAQGGPQNPSQKAQKGKSKGGQRSARDAKTTGSLTSWKKKVTSWHVAAVIIGKLASLHVNVCQKQG